MNVIVLSGTLVKDVEIRHTKNDVAIGNFTIAVRRDIKNKEGNYDTDFVNCVAYGKTAETLNSYFKKGSRILLEGKIQTGSYENSKGEKVYTTNVAVSNINFVDKAEKSNSEIVRDVATENFPLPF